MIKAKDASLNVHESSAIKPEEAAQITGIRKFLFERSFDTDILDTVKKPAEVIEEEEPEEILPTFSEEELRAARDEAFIKGKEQGINETTAGKEQSLLEAMEKIDNQFNNLFQSQEETAASNLNSAILVATTISRKMFPALNERGALAEVEHMVVKTMKSMLEEPKVNIYIHPDLEPLLNKHIGSLSKKVNYRAEIQIVANENMPLGDCRVEWESGGAERNTESMWQEIDEIIERNLQSAPKIADGNDEEAETEENINEDTEIEQ